MSIFLCTVLVIMAWFAWSVWALFKKLGTMVGVADTKDTWIDYVALAPCALALIIIDQVTKIAAKRRK